MARKRRSTRRRTSSRQRAAQNRMKRASKKCKGLPGSRFRACMKREMKTRR